MLYCEVMARWCHLIHRRSLNEFTLTGEEHNPRLGEWYKSGGNDERHGREYAEQCLSETSIESFDLKFPILKWEITPEDQFLTFYEAGYYDALVGAKMAIHSWHVDGTRHGYTTVTLEEQAEYLEGWEDGAGTRFLQILQDYYDDEG